MMGDLTHRGPDGEGLFTEPATGSVLGHRRLSIIDPEGGAQPIQSSGAGPAVAANGMIYNYRNIRETLERERPQTRFQTKSDTEAILQSYIAHGPDGVSTLDGMFAYVIADGHRIVAARDPIGIKPLYTGTKDGALFFASEIKALAGRMDTIDEFPAGHVYDSERGYRQYYTLPEPTSDITDPGEAAALVRTTLTKAVRKRLRSDVPLGAFLSGGLDSSIIAAIAMKELGSLHTFSVGLEGSSDIVAARRVAEYLGTHHHELQLTEADIVDALPSILFHLESYDVDLVRSAVPCWFVSKLAARHVKVVLTGEGADELFAGYTYYKDIADGESLQGELRRSIASMHNINLQRVDRMTMAHGLEARVPFLDTTMIATAARTAPGLKLATGAGQTIEKWILRKAFDDLLPNDIVWRDKLQFDEGSGTAELLSATARRATLGGGNDAEQIWYRQLLCDQFETPEPILSLVAHWADRPAA